MESTNDGKKGGFLKGKSHDDGGIKAIVTDTGQPVELEGDEVSAKKFKTMHLLSVLLFVINFFLLILIIVLNYINYNL